MASQGTLRNVLVGLTFLGSLVIVGTATLVLKGVPWRRTWEIRVYFPNIDNLRVGDDVQVYGRRCGQVEALDFAERDPTGGDNHILVTCSLDVPAPLTTNAEFHVRTASPLGGRFLEIVPQPGESVDESYGRFVGRADGGLFRQLESFMSRHGGDLSSIVSSFSEGLAGFQRIMNDIESGRGTLGRLIQDPVMSADLAGFVAEAREIVENVNRGEGTLGALVRDDDLRERFSQTVTHIERITQSIREGEGLAGMLVADREVRDEAKAIIEDLRETTSQVRQGEGVLGRLVNDRALAETMGEAVDDVHEIVHKANSGEGTLGQAINSREAWDELMRILRLARESIEDLREQAPISTFANAFFSTF